MYYNRNPSSTEFLTRNRNNIIFVRAQSDATISKAKAQTQSSQRKITTVQPIAQAQNNWLTNYLKQLRTKDSMQKQVEHKSTTPRSPRNQTLLLQKSDTAVKTIQNTPLTPDMQKSRQFQRVQSQRSTKLSSTRHLGSQTQEIEDLQLEDYVITKELGKGGYSVVRLALHKATRKRFAIKTYEKKRIQDIQRKQSVEREIKILQRTKHQNIVKLYDILNTPRYVHLVMEFIPGVSLHHYLRFKPGHKLDENESKKLFFQIVQCVKYCHDSNISHRDLKLENLLLSDKNQVKLIDFGFAMIFAPQEKVRLFCGTPNYMAPEIVSRREYEGWQADIWALGVILYAMLCGTYPFKASTDSELYRKIQAGTFTIPRYVSRGARTLILKLLQTKPEQRPSIDQVISDQWFGHHNIMQRPLTIEPSNKPIRSETLPKMSNGLDLDIIHTLKKMGYQESDLITQLSRQNSHVSILYRNMIEGRYPNTAGGVRKSHQ